MIYLAVLIFGALLSVFGPWWIVAPVALIACRLKAKNTRQAFWSSALAVLSLWVGYALYIHISSDVNMLDKMAGVLTSTTEGISSGGNIALIFGITAFLSFLIGGISGLAGYKLKQIQ